MSSIFFRLLDYSKSPLPTVHSARFYNSHSIESSGSIKPFFTKTHFLPLLHLRADYSSPIFCRMASQPGCHLTFEDGTILKNCIPVFWYLVLIIYVIFPCIEEVRKHTLLSLRMLNFKSDSIRKYCQIWTFDQAKHGNCRHWNDCANRNWGLI